MANYSISRRQVGQWQIKLDGKKRVSGFAKTKVEAEMKAKIFARNSGGGEVRIHGLNGKIQDSDTVAPGNDPNPPKDTVH